MQNRCRLGLAPRMGYNTRYIPQVIPFPLNSYKDLSLISLLILTRHLWQHIKKVVISAGAEL